MTNLLFSRLWRDALAQPNKELYVSEYGYPEFFDEISDDINEVSRILCNIHDVAHMSVREIIKATGLSQAAFSVKFCIPKRTVEHWAIGECKCADYIRLMMCKELGILDLDRRSDKSHE